MQAGCEPCRRAQLGIAGLYARGVLGGYSLCDDSLSPSFRGAEVRRPAASRALRRSVVAMSASVRLGWAPGGHRHRADPGGRHPDPWRAAPDGPCDLRADPPPVLAEPVYGGPPRAWRCSVPGSRSAPRPARAAPHLSGTRLSGTRLSGTRSLDELCATPRRAAPSLRAKASRWASARRWGTGRRTATACHGRLEGQGFQCVEREA